MRIEVHTFEAVQVKQPCVACGVWDRPGEPSCWLDEEEWICHDCVERGEEHIRQMFRERAKEHRKIARNYDEAAVADLQLPTLDELEWAADEVERYYEEAQYGR